MAMVMAGVKDRAMEVVMVIAMAPAIAMGKDKGTGAEGMEEVNN
jgi:hypothetical protein